MKTPLRKLLTKDWITKMMLPAMVVLTFMGCSVVDPPSPVDNGLDSGNDVVVDGGGIDGSDVDSGGPSTDVDVPISDVSPTDITPRIACTHFVSTDGSNDASGTSQKAPWKTIAYAAAQAAPGDKVCIKAGNYGNETIVVARHGTKQNPIIFEGYQNAPGDDPDLGWHYPTNVVALDPDVMPLIDGKNRAANVGIRMEKNYIHFRNIQVRNYQVGISFYQASHSRLHNAVLEKFGSLSGTPYTGEGIAINGGNNNVITNSIVVDATRQGFTIVGDNNVVDGCKGYGLDGQSWVSAMAYYFYVQGNGNIVQNSIAYRKPGLPHYGHGFIVKYQGENNIFRNNVVWNMIGAYEARWPDVQNNLWEDNRSLVAAGEKYTAGLTIMNGAKNNTFRRHYSTGAKFGIRYVFSDERGNSISTNAFGDGNIIEDSIFENVTAAFIELVAEPPADFDNVVVKNTLYKNTVFRNKTRHGALYFRNKDSYHGENNVFSGCTFENIARYEANGWEGAAYVNAKEINNGFSLPQVNR